MKVKIKFIILFIISLMSHYFFQFNWMVINNQTVINQLSNVDSNIRYVGLIQFGSSYGFYIVTILTTIILFGKEIKNYFKEAKEFYDENK